MDSPGVSATDCHKLLKCLTLVGVKPSARASKAFFPRPRRQSNPFQRIHLGRGGIGTRL
jgi:hypothetical protein